MADTKLASMTNASAIAAADLLYTVQGGADRQATAAQIKTFTSAAPTMVGTVTMTGGNLTSNAAGGFAGALNFDGSGVVFTRNDELTTKLASAGDWGGGQEGFFLRSSGALSWSSISQAGGTSTDTSVSRTAAGVLEVNNGTPGTKRDINARYVGRAPLTVATLVAASTAGAGVSSFVTDATAPTYGATVVGGGAVATPVYSDGAAWKVG